MTAALRARELGASVALVERDAFGGTCTNDVSKEVERCFERDGMKVMTGIQRCEGIASAAEGRTVRYSAGVHAEKSYVIVDGNMQTNIDSIYAAGDVGAHTE